MIAFIRPSVGGFAQGVKTFFLGRCLVRCAGERRRKVGFGSEGIRVELIGRQLAARREIGPCGIDHHRRPTRVYLIAGEVRHVLHDRMMHEAAASLPLVIRRGAGNNGYVAEVRHGTRPFFA